MSRVASYVGSFNKRSGTGTQTIAGVVDENGAPFEPTAFIFWSVAQGATGIFARTQWQSFGVDDGTNHFAVSHASQQTVLATAHGYRNDSSLLFVDFSPAVVVAGHVSSTASGSYVMDWTTGNAFFDGILVNFVAFGGSNLRAVAGDFLTTGSTGHQSITGLPFRPTAVMFFASTSSTSSTFASTPGFGPNGIGWFTGNGQGATSNDTAVGPGRLRRYQRTNRCIATAGYAGFSYEADAVSLDAAGFTVNCDVARSGRVAYLALSGVRAQAGAIVAPTTSGSATITTTMVPSVAFFASNGNVVSSVNDDTANEMCFGACDATNRQRVNWSCDRDAAGTTATYESDAFAIITANKPSGTITTIESQGVVTVGNPNVTVDWTITNSDQAQVLYLILGDGSAAGPQPINYEDPCAIEGPRVFAKVTTESDTIKVGVHPLRDTDAMGGFAEPRLLTVSPIVKAASDPSTGAWSAQTATMRWADTDRANRTLSNTRTSFRNCPAEIYLTSTPQRLAAGPPRVLFSGTVYSDAADENLVFTQQINDLLGSSYSLFSEEKMIPQRVIGIAHFPNAPTDALGRGEPIIGGRVAPLNPATAQGVVEGITVGEITIGGTPGVPGPTDLATVVAALQASVTAGTTYVDWGGKIGYADAIVLEGMGTVPSTYAALAAVIGFADLDALLNTTATTGGSSYGAVLVAGHAITTILTGINSDPSVWINDTQLDGAQLGTTWWAPQIIGDTTWASQFGTDRFTDILGSDGTTRRYTLILFDPASDYWTQILAGGKVHLDCEGMEDLADGTGTLITDYFSLYRHVLVNFLLQNYLTGGWLPIPQFLFSDGTTYLDRVDSQSFATAYTVAALTLTGGRLGSFVIQDRTSIRDVITRFNFSGGCLLAQDDYGRLFIKILDTRRTEFLSNRFTGVLHRTLRDKVDFLPGFKVTPKPEWQTNQVFYQYAMNYHTNQYERGEGGGGVAPVEYLAGQTRDGVLKKTLQFPYLRDDATALNVAAYYRDLFANLPHVVEYSRRGLCGLEDDVLDGVPVTHYNGYGANGYVDRALWILSTTTDPMRMYRSFTALDVDLLVS